MEKSNGDRIMKKIFLLLLFFTLCSSCIGAEKPFRVMFYNTENLFDTIDNPRKNDNEFLPASAKYWNSKKYWTKQNNLAKVITALGEWDTPALIGLCEVENKEVLDDLTKKTPLKSQQYRYIITDCEDLRGINVALLYQRDRFRLLQSHAYPIRFPANKRKKTREILHVAGQVTSGDTLDVFVCHFPSRQGGEEKSEPDRIYVASVLRAKVDSLMRIRRHPYVLIMGDLNDEPSNKSIFNTLNARPIDNSMAASQLYNLFYAFEKQERKGSYKYGSQWNVIDQIIVSGSLLNPNAPFRALPETATIFIQDFMMTTDKSHGGKRPKKTFHGMKYEAGFSDHLPVYIDLIIQKKKEDGR